MLYLFTNILSLDRPREYGLDSVLKISIGTVIYCYIKLYKTDKLANLFSTLHYIAIALLQCRPGNDL